MKLRLRNLALAALMMATSLPLLAEESKDCVLVSSVEGTEVYIQLSDKPCVTVESGQVKVATDTEAILFEFAERPKFEFIKRVVSGVGDIEDSGIILKYDGAILSLSGLDAGDQVEVFDLSGILIATGDADVSRSWEIATGSWKAGMYIVKTNKLTTKIIKK